MKINFTSSLTFESVAKIRQIKPTKHNVHILDSGNHGHDIMHFAQALMGNKENVNLELHEIETSRYASDAKQISSLLTTLDLLNLKKGDFVSIPALATANLLALQKAFNKIFKPDIQLNSRNLIEHREQIEKLLAIFYKEKDEFLRELNSIDSFKQEFNFLYPLIQKINKLVDKGVNIYIPAQPNDYPIRNEVQKLDLKDELYAYISKGKDDNDRMKNLINQIQNSDIEDYNFNLLALSKAHITDANNIYGEKYIYKSLDGLSNDSARGVYNFCPIRDKDFNLRGFSFHDESTVEYKINDFPGLKQIINLLDFVGLDIRELIATEEEHEIFREMRNFYKSFSKLPNKLYRIKDIFSEKEIEDKKLNLLGDFINRNEDLVFDVNKKEQVVYQKCNCEGSERPSVVTMWGPCFSTIKAIDRDVNKVSQENR